MNNLKISDHFSINEIFIYSFNYVDYQWFIAEKSKSQKMNQKRQKMK